MSSFSVLALTVFAEQFKSSGRDTAKKRTHTFANAETVPADTADSSQVK